MLRGSRWTAVACVALVGANGGCGRSLLRDTSPSAGGAGGAKPAADAAVADDAMPGPDAARTDGTRDNRPLGCGNGRLEADEECDDGNLEPGDGCDRNCRLECNWDPCWPPPRRTAICGDGVRSGAEQCDDGNVTPGDGCTSACALEPGYRCSVPGRRCTAICGDRMMAAGETCDDGNVSGGDGCSDICLVEPGWVCQDGACRRLPILDGGVLVPPREYCGDGVIEGAEECDEGPLDSDANYGGCGAHCLYVFCGDGLLNGDEQCDQGLLGNTGAYGDRLGCTRNCTRPSYCGDGIVDFDYGETCDTPAASTWDCTADCMQVLY